ncbi:MAG: DNA polymerase III subunit gamma and tau [Actinomycetota bacterium]
MPAEVQTTHVGASIRVAAVSTALYRTYRPSRLDDVVGQDHIAGPLRRALENDRIHHAYLFSGPRGCGKTSTARILARSLNCESGPTPDPCGTCRSCVELAAEGPGSIDVIELDAASHGSVEDTRLLRERAVFAPVSSRYKIYIIDEAHMISTQGFNALLKLVEEPPEHVRFIFATTEAEKVIPTIRSRTHNYSFRLVPAKVLQEHLAWICAQEGIDAEPAALALVARAGGGSVRDSLSLLGQVIAGAGPAGVTYADAVVQLGMTDSALLDDVVDALAVHDGAQLLRVIDRVIDAGHDPRRFTGDLLERLRDLIVLQNIPEAAESGLIDAPEDQVAREVAQAQAISAAGLSRAADIVSTTLGTLKGASSPRLQLELMAARLVIPAADESPSGLRARIDQLEKAMTAGVVATPAAAPAPAPTPPPKLSDVAPSSSATTKAPAKKAESTSAKKAPAPEPEKEAPAVKAASKEMSVADFVTMWPAVLDALKGYSRVAWMAFADSRPVSVSGGVLAVGVDTQGKINNSRSSGHDERLRHSILDVMRVDVTVDVVLGPDVLGVQGSAGGDEEPDVPRRDDATVDETTGVDLAMQELGATTIGEIEH